MIQKAFSSLQYSVLQSTRVAQYLAQSLVGSRLLGRSPNPEQISELPPVKVFLQDLYELCSKDLRHILQSDYKMPQQLFPTPFEFVRASARVFEDLLRVRRRYKDRSVQDVGDTPLLAQMPKYFAQTFHFQTDGYLSEKSASLYDHQVEMVFAGGADAMRRQGLLPLNNFVSGKDTSSLKLLDVATGTGAFLEAVKENYPLLQTTGLDLSPYYLKASRKRLSNFERVDFVEANAETIPFRDATFDVVSCVYLFHELPRRVRGLVAKEMARVLKPGGLLVFIDSIQLGDRSDFDASLKLFPVLYHEPYYLDFIEHDLSDLFVECGFENISKERAFFSSIWSATKSTKHE